MIEKLRWDKAIFFFDVDDTLIDTYSNSLKASEAIFATFKNNLGEEKAFHIQKRFKEIFQIMAGGHWGGAGDVVEHDKIINRIKALQKPVIGEYGSIRKWSREVIVKIAGEDSGINLEKNLIYEAVDRYWTRISELSMPKAGVLELFQEIKKHDRPAYLVTGSDARLEENEQGLFPTIRKNLRVLKPGEWSFYEKTAFILIKSVSAIRKISRILIFSRKR